MLIFLFCLFLKILNSEYQLSLGEAAWKTVKPDSVKELN